MSFSSWPSIFRSICYSNFLGSHSDLSSECDHKFSLSMLNVNKNRKRQNENKNVDMNDNN